MKRRWIIRILFMLPILLCVGGWAWSVTRDSTIDCLYHGKGGRFYSGGGIVQLIIRWDYLRDEKPMDMWFFEVTERPPSLITWGSQFDFQYSESSGDIGNHFWLNFPYWLPLLFLSGLYFFVWRKTRSKINPKLAFPIELAAKEIQP